jgi:hypothetical protein
VTASRSLVARAGGLLRSLVTQGPRVTLRYLMRRSGSRIEWFYWVREILPETIPAEYRTLPEGYRLEPLSDADFVTLGQYQDDGENASTELMRERARQGHTALGMKRGEKVVAFTWFALDRTQTLLYPRTMRPNEAYLFNSYVLPEERGHNLAVIMRYRSYLLLRELGRDTLYSITIKANTASWRFKEKLGAEKLFLVLYVCLLGKLEWRWYLRRYSLSHNLPSHT